MWMYVNECLVMSRCRGEALEICARGVQRAGPNLADELGWLG